VQQLQRQSGYSFILDEDYLVQAHPVTLSLKGVEILDALSYVFEGQPFGYKVEGKVVYFTSRERAKLTGVMSGKSVQQRTVSGRVTDSDGVPLEGVTVRVKGTTTAASTSADGRYEIVVPNTDGTLVFSNIGFETKELKVNDQHVVDVLLKAEISELEEVVVVGYGTQKKADITGSVASVDGQ